jgi:hypothetical protein
MSEPRNADALFEVSSNREPWWNQQKYLSDLVNCPVCNSWR